MKDLVGRVLLVCDDDVVGECYHSHRHAYDEVILGRSWTSF